jgi:hypothetical protein
LPSFDNVWKNFSFLSKKINQISPI